MLLSPPELVKLSIPFLLPTYQVTNCTVSIQAVAAQQMALQPGVVTPASAFEIYVQDSLAANRSCWLVLFDSQVNPNPEHATSRRCHA